MEEETGAGATAWKVLKVLIETGNKTLPWTKASYLEVASLRGSFWSGWSIERAGVFSLRKC